MLLFCLVFIRMSGFVFLNPILGRRNIPSVIRGGLTLVLTFITFGTFSAAGISEASSLVDSPLFFGILALKEFAIGYLLGFVMEIYDMVPVFAGTVIDFMMGTSMAQVFDPQRGAQMSLTGNMLQTFYLLLFFASDAHLALMKILLTSGELLPYGSIAFSAQAVSLLLDLFTACVVLAVRLAFPLIAFEMIVQLTIGVMMKVNPQVNLFVLGIQLRIVIGMAMMVFLVTPFRDFLLTIITEMTDALSDVLRIAAV